jgi:hypothetical protein
MTLQYQLTRNFHAATQRYVNTINIEQPYIMLFELDLFDTPQAAASFVEGLTDIINNNKTNFVSLPQSTLRISADQTTIEYEGESKLENINLTTADLLALAKDWHAFLLQQENENPSPPL